MRETAGETAGTRKGGRERHIGSGSAAEGESGRGRERRRE